MSRDRYASLATQTVLSQNGPMLARVCITDYFGNILLDVLVLPTEEVTNYFTETTGFLPAHFHGEASTFRRARDLAGLLLKGKIIIGYRLWLSLSALRLSHPADQTRDCATYFPFQTNVTSSEDDFFKLLVQNFMKRTIREGFINAVEDARAAMDLFRSAEIDWETLIAKLIWPCLLPPPEYLICYS